MGVRALRLGMRELLPATASALALTPQPVRSDFPYSRPEWISWNADTAISRASLKSG